MRKPVIILSVALLANSALAMWLGQELREQRELNAALADEVSRLQSASRQPVQPTPASPPSAPTPQSTTTTSPISTPVAAVEGPVHVQGTEKEWESQRRRLFQDAQYRDAWREERRLGYARHRDNLMRILGFTAEQADGVVALTVERELARRQKELAPSEVSAEEAAFQDELRALLGEQQRQKLANYMESRPTRTMVDLWRSEFAGTDALREDQIEPLIAALHVERAQTRKTLNEYRESLRGTGNGNLPELYGERETEELRAMHQRMHDGAATVLTFSQLERLDALLERQRERREHELRMDRLQRKVAVRAEAQPD